mmetsp:Transcript_92233/g.298291  ORF Transcript_92233/g.298291 Transcript_92233/m.298291 type:complete len:189 (-) Transcript_92233:198-764(-)
MSAHSDEHHPEESTNGHTKGRADLREGGHRHGRFKYRCQIFAESSSVGADGKTHTERFASLDIGDLAQGLREAHQAYSNSANGVAKIGLERHLGDRAMKTVTEFDSRTNQEKCSEMFRGMTVEQRGAFLQDFASKVRRMCQSPDSPAPCTPNLRFVNMGAPSQGVRLVHCSAGSGKTCAELGGLRSKL